MHKLSHNLHVITPAFLGTVVQFPVPWVEVYASSFASSSAVQSPLFTVDLSQHGGLPISPNTALIDIGRHSHEGGRKRGVLMVM